MKNNLIYKKLFKIHYNDKEFQLFCDRYNRITFLEIKNNKFNYLDIKDFFELNKIYNINNPFISYDIGKKKNKFTFKEFVRVFVGNVSFLVSVITLSNVITTSTFGNKATFKIEDNKIKINVEYVDEYLIKDTKELDDLLGITEVSLDEIKDVIDSNDNLDDLYKEYSYKLASFLKCKYPFSDQRIFYDNLKTINIKTLNPGLNSGVIGTYNSLDNVISFKEGFFDNEEVILHELAHSYHNWKEDKLFFSKNRNEAIGYSLDEAMTNRIISDITSISTYNREGRILNYLLKHVDYSYYDYEREGISKLVSLLKEKYPSLDIDYLISFCDAMHKTSLYTAEYIRFEEYEEIMDLFFEMCLLNIKFDKFNYYQSFNDFVKLCSSIQYEEVLDDYLEKYNDYLIENSVDKKYIQNDIKYFISYTSQFESFKNNFKSYLRQNTLEKIDEDKYSIFKHYLSFPVFLSESYTSLDEVNNYFYDMLDIYNNHLFLNGFNNDEVITCDKFKTIIDKYSNIEIIGYIIDINDNLYPMIETKDKEHLDKYVYIDYNGEFNLIDKTKVKSFSIFENKISKQYKFLNYLFSNVDKENICLDREFWESYFGICGFEYKKIDLLYNGEVIGSEYIDNLKVRIGQRSDGSNTFSLYSLDEAIIDDSSCVVYQTLSLKDYLCDDLYKDSNINSLEIDKYLNYSYIKNKICGYNLNDTNSVYYDQLTYDKERDVINVHSPYYIKINDLNIETTLNRIILDIGSGYADIWYNGIIDSAKSYVSYNGEKETIYLETVLRYYGYLDMGVNKFVLNSEQILELYSMYVNEVYSFSKKK